MVRSLSPGFLDELRQRVNLASLVSEHVDWDVRKSNAKKQDFWSPCPFHEEKRSSFHVDGRKGFYYCFGCHAKGDAISFLKEIHGLSFDEAVFALASRTECELSFERAQGKGINLDDLVDVKDFIVENFTQENFLELGIKTGWSEFINSHPRLLRSLSWGDPDYPSCVMELISRMQSRNDGSIEKIHEYLNKRFSNEVSAAVSVVAFEASEKYLGYRFEAPRNDIISVMMPFSGGFGEVYEAIKLSASRTALPVKRADEVWDHSVVINDILQLINHSAVVICDLTGRNENVFYELGVAHAWGKAVIPITQNADDVPFDLRHHRYLKYLNNSEGRKELTEQLAKRLVGLVGQNPLF